MSNSPSAAAANAALRKAGMRTRLTGKIPGGNIRCLLMLPTDALDAVKVLSARFPMATVFVESEYTVTIKP
jgi:hypothetical protein